MIYLGDKNLSVIGGGKSPFEYAVEVGFDGTEDEFKQAMADMPGLTMEDVVPAIEDAVKDKLGTEDLQGAIDTALAQAKASGEFDGKDGEAGPAGSDGQPGKDGYSPVKGVDYFDGYTPVKGVDYFDGEPGATGADGRPGADGITPHIGYNGNWFTGETDTGVSATGPAGEAGTDGAQGADGQPGADGQSAYELACKKGFEGTEEEWLESLRVRVEIDSTPTASSENLITSGGVKSYVDSNIPDVVAESATIFSKSVLLGKYTRADTSVTTAENFTLTLSESIDNFVFIWVAVRSSTYIMGSQFCPIALFKQGITLECNCINDQSNLFIGNAKYVSATSVSGKVSMKAPSFEVYGVGRIAG